MRKKVGCSSKRDRKPRVTSSRRCREEEERVVVSGLPKESPGVQTRSGFLPRRERKLAKCVY